MLKQAIIPYKFPFLIGRIKVIIDSGAFSMMREFPFLIGRIKRNFLEA